MNREILFRGKRLDNDEWLYGDLMHDDHQGCYIYPNDCTGLYTENKVDTDTVGQFTGMCDKNGVKIFEGDVLDVIVFDCFDNDKQYRVRVEWAGTEFIGVDVTNDDYAWNLFWLCNQDEEIEAIGNIYDTQNC